MLHIEFDDSPEVAKFVLRLPMSTTTDLEVPEVFIETASNGRTAEPSFIQVLPMERRVRLFYDLEDEEVEFGGRFMTKAEFDDIKDDLVEVTG